MQDEYGTGPSGPEEQQPVVTTLPPPTTEPPTPATSLVSADDAGAKDIVAQTKAYQFSRNPADAFEAFINLLLDQKIFFIAGLGSGALSGSSGEPLLDPFGLATAEGGPAFETQVGWGGTAGERADMVEIASDEGQKIALEAWLSETNTTPAGAVTGELSETQREDFDEWRAITFAGNSHMYLFDDGTGQATQIAIVPSYDGGIYGNMSTIEEALRSVPLDKPMLDAFTLNMSRSDPRKYRALQSVMSMMGYYGNNIPAIRWGSHTYIDRNAFMWMMDDILTEELAAAQYNRMNPDNPMPNPTIRSFVDRKYSDHLKESVRQANASADGLAAFSGDVTAHLTDSITQSLNYLGQSLTPSMQNRIDSMVSEMVMEGDLDAAAILNTDLVGMQVGDDSLRTADAWLAAFHGNEEGWEDNIQFGINGTPTELLRIAQGAGVDLTGVDVQAWHGGTVREIGPDGEIRDAVPAGVFAPISGMTNEQRHNVARWYFLTLLQQNNNNLSATANQYANTIGNRVFENAGFDDTWLDNTVRLANQDPTSFAYRQGWETYEEQNQERIDALNDAGARFRATEEFSNITNRASQKALGAALSALGGRSRQRQRRL